jgi:hypothetical protein
MVPSLLLDRRPPPLSRETLGAGAPVDHLRFIDLVTRVGAGGQARGVADGAIDIDRFPACATDQVVVVVTDTILVEGRRSGGLDATDESLLDQDPKGIVHRLSGDGADLGANVLGDVVGRAVGPTRHRPQHGQALGRDLDTMFAKEVGWISSHLRIVVRFWTLSSVCLSPIDSWLGTGWPLAKTLPEPASVTPVNGVSSKHSFAVQVSSAVQAPAAATG